MRCFCAGADLHIPAPPCTAPQGGTQAHFDPDQGKPLYRALDFVRENPVFGFYNLIENDSQYQHSTPTMSSTALATLNRRTLVQSLAFFALLPAAHSASAQINLSTAINRTARFRALSQRIAKAYTQTYLGVLPGTAKDVLATAQRLVQVGFEDIAKGQFNTDISRQIGNVRAQAATLASLVERAPNKDNVAAVAAQADKMLTVADQATAAMESLAPQSSAKLINLAGRQRYLSQRMAKNYFLVAADLAGNPGREQLQADRAEFKQALRTLADAPISTNGIRNELALAQSQWVFFESAINRKPDSAGLSDVATTSERLLDVMNNLTTMYDDALKSVLG